MNKEKVDYNKLFKEFNNNKIALMENNYFINKKEYEYKELEGMMNGIPIFTKFAEKVKLPFSPIILEETDDFIFVLNDKTPYEELDGKLACGMSFVHFFGIPKKRIYNCVSLKNEDKPLINNMKNKAIEYFNSNKDVLIDFIQKHIESKINKLTLSEDEKNKILNKTKKYVEIVNTSSGKDLGYYFHPHPYHSVGHLHLHVILEKTRTSDEHNWKNVPIETVLELIK